MLVPNNTMDATDPTKLDESSRRAINISAPELSFGLPCHEVNRSLTMALVTQDGYPKLEIRRWKLDGNSQRRRLDGVMLKQDEAQKLFELLPKLSKLAKDKNFAVNDTLVLFWKGTDSTPFLKITRSYPGDAFAAKSFVMGKDMVDESGQHSKVIMEIFDLMNRRYKLVLESGNINQCGVMDNDKVQKLSKKLRDEIETLTGGKADVESVQKPLATVTTDNEDDDTDDSVKSYVPLTQYEKKQAPKRGRSAVKNVTAQKKFKSCKQEDESCKPVEFSD